VLKYFKKQDYGFLLSLLLGITSMIAVFVIIASARSRYILQFWPIGIFVFANFGLGIRLVTAILTSITDKKRIVISIVTIVLVITGIFSAINNLNFAYHPSRLLDFTLLVVLIAAIISFAPKAMIFNVLENIKYNRIKYANRVIVIIALISLLNAYEHPGTHFKSLFSLKPLLSASNLPLGPPPHSGSVPNRIISWNSASESLFETLNKNQTIYFCGPYGLTWIKAFAPVNIDNVHLINGTFGPNFTPMNIEDDIDEIKTNGDKVLISYAFEDIHPVYAKTLLKKLQAAGWRVNYIEYFGVILGNQ
jgi:hypothetical protein